MGSAPRAARPAGGSHLEEAGFQMLARDLEEEGDYVFPLFQVLHDCKLAWGMDDLLLNGPRLPRPDLKLI